MAIASFRQTQTRQPSSHGRVNTKSRLTNGITHLWTATVMMNAVDGQPVKLAGTTPLSIASGKHGLGFRTTASVNSNLYLPADAAQINSRHPWGLAALVNYDNTLTNFSNSASSPFITIGAANSNVATFDRTMGTSPTAVVASGMLFDGGNKQVNGGTIFPTTISNDHAIMITAHDGFIHVFVDGNEDATPVAVGNNGFNGYTAGSCFLLWGNCTNNTSGGTGYIIEMLAKTDNAFYTVDDAKSFYSNPWQYWA